MAKTSVAEKFRDNSGNSGNSEENKPGPKDRSHLKGGNNQQQQQQQSQYVAKDIIRQQQQQDISM